MKRLVIVRGGGELASGAIHCLYRAGFRVLVLEQAEPTATRRKVSFSDAMYKGEAEVERVVCYLAKNEKEAKKRLKKGELVMLKDPGAKCIKELEKRIDHARCDFDVAVTHFREYILHIMRKVLHALVAHGSGHTLQGMCSTEDLVDRVHVLRVLLQSQHICVEIL